jgi:hypothetical protein
MCIMVHFCSLEAAGVESVSHGLHCSAPTDSNSILCAEPPCCFLCHSQCCASLLFASDVFVRLAAARLELRLQQQLWWLVQLQRSVLRQ